VVRQQTAAGPARAEFHETDQAAARAIGRAGAKITSLLFASCPRGATKKFRRMLRQK